MDCRRRGVAHHCVELYPHPYSWLRRQQLGNPYCVFFDGGCLLCLRATVLSNSLSGTERPHLHCRNHFPYLCFDPHTYREFLVNPASAFCADRSILRKHLPAGAKAVFIRKGLIFVLINNDAGSHHEYAVAAEKWLILQADFYPIYTWSSENFISRLPFCF